MTLKKIQLPGSQSLVFFVNGKKVIENNPDPEMFLVEYLRQKLHLIGTKVGCGEGGCGACTVMISRVDHHTGQVRHSAVVACLMPLCAVHGTAVTTVEGIGSTQSRLHPVQERLAKAHGSQCGFCTPGFVMSMYALLRSNPEPSMHELEKTFQGNLCRCTGYRPIIEGYRTFTKEFQCAMGDKCCRRGNVAVDDKLFDKSEFQPYSPSQEPIFPPELKLTKPVEELAVFKGPRVTWLKPATLKHLKEIKKTFPEAKLVNGNTEVGLEMKQKIFPILICLDGIAELKEVKKLGSGLKFGSSTTLTEMEEILKEEIATRNDDETKTFKAVLEMLHWFSGTQVRNVATAVGNIATASPISDLNPIFLAVGVELEVLDIKGKVKTVKMDSKFFPGYRMTILSPSDVILSIHIPKSLPNQFVLAYKQSKRRDDDIAIVNMAINVLRANGVTTVTLAYGGVGPMTLMPLENVAFKHDWNPELLEVLMTQVSSKIQMTFDAPGGEVNYRRSLVLSLLYKAYVAIAACSDREKSAVEPIQRDEFKSTQLFEKTPDSQPSTDPIGRPVVSISGLKQATGEAIFLDDIPRSDNELFLALVLSTKAHARFTVDATEALKLPGVVKFFSSEDLSQECNLYGIAIQDEEIFARDKVVTEGQIIGGIAATSQKLAREAAGLVQVTYENLPAIFTLEEAIQKESFFPNYPLKLEIGNVDHEFESKLSLRGSFRTGKQDHFYLEPHGSLAIPRDADELEVFSSTQWPKYVQQGIARATGTLEHKILVRVKRLGGAFGGKETRCQAVALPTGFAARRLNRPVRCILERHEDMLVTGTRNPILFEWKVAYTPEGLVTGLDCKVWVNAGATMDCSCFVLERALMHVQNAYNVPNTRVQGWVCRTNTVSNTVFRGSGSPQGVMVGEQFIREIARTINRDYIEIMDMNLYREGHITHYNQTLLNCNVERCFKEVIQGCDFHKRKAEVDEFNKENRWKKRGITVMPTMYGVGYIPVAVNQAGALVHIYTDGSVLVTHGGIEFGQGIHTKMVQIASRVLEIPIEKIHTMEVATDKVPNNMATSASVGADLNGPAVMNACQTLKDRLAPLKEQYPNESWEFLCQKAYDERIHLSATGFYKAPGVGYDFVTNSGNAWIYFSFGAACTEVEIDCLTGDHRVRRVNIVMDVGSSLNPAIDVGQIEGAFVQGYGLFTMEEVLYSTDGRLLTKGPGNYKIPGLSDIPGEINVALLTGAPNPRAIYSSKAVGEPPLHLSSSVFFALKEAIIAARAEEGLGASFDFFAPATSSGIRMACQDQFTKRGHIEQQAGMKSWSMQI